MRSAGIRSTRTPTDTKRGTHEKAEATATKDLHPRCRMPRAPDRPERTTSASISTITTRRAISSGSTCTTSRNPGLPLSGTSLALTADGYPLANAATSFVTTDYPAGDYEFSYTGAGTVAFSNGQLVGSVTVIGRRDHGHRGHQRTRSATRARSRCR